MTGIRRDRAGRRTPPGSSEWLLLRSCRLAFGAPDGLGVTVLLVALLVLIRADRLQLTIRDGRDVVARNARISEELLGRVGALLTQTQVVLFTATLVAVAFERELDVRVLLEEVRISLQRLLRVRTDVRLIEVEVRRLHGLAEQILLARTRRRWRRWRRRRRCSDRDARGAGGVSTRPGSRQSVRRRVFRCYRL